MADQPSIGELSTPPPISGEMPTSVTAFVDFFASGPINTPTPIASFLEFQQTFGGLDVRSESSYQVWQFFSNGGEAAIIVRIAPHPSTANFVSALNSALADLTVPFNLLCLPATTNLAPAEMNLTLLAAQAFCTEKNAFYIVDIPPSNVISTAPAIESWFAGTRLSNSDFAAVYYPQLSILDPLNGNAPREMPASGSVAGIYATTDSTRGVWKAPAGTSATITGATPSVAIDDATSAQLSLNGINAIRTFPVYGTVVWGARTTVGANNLDYKYVNVRRLATYIEQSLKSGLQWVVFEPNNPTLWASIRLTASTFLNRLWQQGSFMGTTPQQAYFVKCDATTMTQNDIDNGRINIQIGFAPLKPAEFVLISITMLAAQSKKPSL
jgi:phage tail sheath protein FI